MIFTIIKQELKLAFKRPASLLNPLIFFFIAISIYAITFNNQISTAIIWLCLTFSILLGATNSFKEDFNDSTIEQLYISSSIFELTIAAKIFANWLIYCLPLIAFLPVSAIFLKLNNATMPDLIIISIIVTLIITLIASFANCLILSASSSHSLITILVLPLAIPILIFAGSAFDNSNINNYSKAIKFLTALLIFLAPILIFATAAAVKMNIKE